MTKTFLVNRFHKAGIKGFVNLNNSSYYFTCKIIYVHLV